MKKSLRISKPEATRVLIIGLYNDVTKNSTVIKRTNQKTELLLKIESDTVTKNRTVIKRTNQKTVLLLKIESDIVTKNNGPIRRDLEESQVYKKE